VATDLNEYTYDLADQIQDRSLNSTVVETFAHDDDGNMISRTVVAGPDTTDYRRNDEDRLTRILLPTTAEEVYRYDTDGIRKYTDNTTSYYSSGGTSVAETNPGGDVSYIQGHVLLGLDLAGTFYYYLTDALSSVRLIVDASGSEVASFVHNEFGILEAATGSSSLRAHTYVGGAGVRNETGFSGLYYMRQRWYEPGLGRFLRQDPIGFDGGLNLYNYVGQNPLNSSDPSGLDGDLTIHSRPGHSWLEYKYTSGPNAGKSHTYGAWPTTEETPYSGVHVDVEKSMKLNSVSMTWHVKGKREGDFLKWLRNEMQNRTWTPTSNCADFATQGWEFVTGERLNNSSWRSAGIASPDELMKVINPKQVTLVNTGNSFTDSTGSGSKGTSGVLGSLSGGLTGSTNSTAQSLGKLSGYFWPW